MKAGGLQTASYLGLNPNGKAPTLVDGDTVLWEASAIMAYLSIKAGSDMWPAHNPAEQVQVLRWLSWNDGHWAREVGPFYFEHVVKAQFGMGAARTSLDRGLRTGGTPLKVSTRSPGRQGLRGLREADDRRLPARLDGDRLACLGDALRGVSEHRAMARRAAASAWAAPWPATSRKA